MILVDATMRTNCSVGVDADANDVVREARLQLAATAKSGDPVATNRYAQALQQAVSARDRLAAESLGNGAQQFLSTLPE